MSEWFSQKDGGKISERGKDSKSLAAKEEEISLC